MILFKVDIRMLLRHRADHVLALLKDDLTAELMKEAANRLEEQQGATMQLAQSIAQLDEQRKHLELRIEQMGTVIPLLREIERHAALPKEALDVLRDLLSKDKAIADLAQKSVDAWKELVAGYAKKVDAEADEPSPKHERPGPRRS